MYKKEDLHTLTGPDVSLYGLYLTLFPGITAPDTLDGLFSALCRLRDTTAEMFINGTYFAQILKSGGSFMVRLLEYSKDARRKLEEAASIRGTRKSGSNDELIEEMYAALPDTDVACVMLVHFGDFHEYYAEFIKTE